MTYSVNLTQIISLIHNQQKGSLQGQTLADEDHGGHPGAGPLYTWKNQHQLIG